MGTHYIVHLKQSCMYIYTLIMASDVSFRELLIKGSKPYCECEIHINMQYQNGALALNHSYFDAPFRMCHLSGIFLETLQKRQADLSISKRDVLCVQIAALCRTWVRDHSHTCLKNLYFLKYEPAGNIGR